MVKIGDPKKTLVSLSAVEPKFTTDFPEVAIWKWCCVLSGWTQWTGAECVESRVAVPVVQGMVQGEGQVLSPMWAEMGSAMAWSVYDAGESCDVSVGGCGSQVARISLGPWWIAYVNGRCVVRGRHDNVRHRRQSFDKGETTGSRRASFAGGAKVRSSGPRRHRSRGRATEHGRANSWREVVYTTSVLQRGCSGPMRRRSKGRVAEHGRTNSWREVLHTTSVLPPQM